MTMAHGVLIATTNPLYAQEVGKADWWGLMAFFCGSLVFLGLLSMQLYECRREGTTQRDVRKALAVYAVICIWGDVVVCIISNVCEWSLVTTLVVFLIGLAIVWLPGRRYVKQVIDLEKMKKWPFF